MLNVFSVDVEDWYQSSFKIDASISNICVQNTYKVLSFLEKHDVRGTFFVQGLVAKTFPNLVKEIYSSGHEIQSHGLTHKAVNMMKPGEFKKELEETNKIIEDITGKKVTGFRAPDFSIDRGSFWAFEVMYECGIRFDSSIFPLKTRRYGINGFRRGYSIIKTPSGEIEELPVSVLEFSLNSINFRVPVGGGGYFRLFPQWFLNYSLSKINEEGLPFVIYCHPYEFNPKEWQQIKKHVPLYKRLHQGLGRGSFQSKLSKILQSAKFTTMSEVLEEIKTKGLQAS